MEFYLNNVYFMNGYYGIQAACHGYFNCELSDLDLSQTAFLCAIPNSPTYYDPINNKDHTLTRRNLILKNLREDGKITQQEYDTAINEEITLNMPEKDDTVKYNYVDTYAYYCATRALMENEGFKFKYYFDSDDEEKEYDASYDEMYSYCQKKLYSDGYKIYTSIDLTMQQQLQDSIDLTLLDFTDTTDDGTFKLQSAATCIDNDTGEVVAIVGGRSQDAVSHTLNRAFQSHRQPGSSIKPLIVYTPSFERGKTPDTIVNDHKFDGGPSNSGDSYYGDVTIRFAVQKSLNTVAWQLYDELTPKVGLQYLKDMNFTNIVKDDYVTATALGGFTTGVSTLEMASAYSTLENDGMYRNPTCIKSIVDSDNNIIYTSSQKDTVIYTETASRMMTDVMTDVMKSGTGRSANLDNGMPCAGKTGTTNDKKDGWFCGFTRYYTTCVWVGCDMPETVKKLTGSSYPAEIWKNYMDQIHADLTPIDFLPYAQISDDYQDSQDTPADDQTQNNPTDQTVTTPDAGTTTPDKTTTDTNKTDAAGGNHEKHLLHHQKIHQVEPETVVQSEAQVELETVVQPETQVEPETVVQPEVQVELEAVVQPEVQVEPEAAVQPEAQVELPVVPPEAKQPSRFFFAVLSGVVFFAAYAPVTIGNKMIDALIYSVTYNGSYLAVEEIITIIVISIPPVKKALDYVKQMANSR